MFVPLVPRDYADRVSADGSTVVGFSDVWSIQEAFLWDATHGMRELEQVLTNLELNLTGWDLTDATGISFGGQTIAGYGLNPYGQQEAWLAMIPEPGTGLLVMTGVLGLAASRRRHAKRSTCFPA